MPRKPLHEDIRALLADKKLKCSPDAIHLIEGICKALREQGVGQDREIFEFVIDVLRAMSLCELSPESGLDDILAKKDLITDWLEAMGWRRNWFERPVQRDWAA